MTEQKNAVTYKRHGHRVTWTQGIVSFTIECQSVPRAEQLIRSYEEWAARRPDMPIEWIIERATEVARDAARAARKAIRGSAFGTRR